MHMFVTESTCFVHLQHNTNFSTNALRSNILGYTSQQYYHNTYTPQHVIPIWDQYKS